MRCVVQKLVALIVHLTGASSARAAGANRSDTASTATRDASQPASLNKVSLNKVIPRVGADSLSPQRGSHPEFPHNSGEIVGRHALRLSGTTVFVLAQ